LSATNKGGAGCNSENEGGDFHKKFFSGKNEICAKKSRFYLAPKKNILFIKQKIKKGCTNSAGWSDKLEGR
jgi:hypothetical protein